MEYRMLGGSDLRVSALGLGAMTFGAATSEQEAFRQLDLAIEAGINFFDTAENYPAPILPGTQGRSEEILGRWIAARKIRQQVIVATKVSGPGNSAGDMTHIRGPHRRLDRSNIESAVDASLRRLGVEYIDLYQVHWPERPISTLGRSRFSHIPDGPALIPIEETLEALARIVQNGKVRQIGVANETPWGVMRYLCAAAQRGLPRIVSIQNGYNLLDRQFEIGLAEVALREKVGLIAYSPLARGLLTGKYLGEKGKGLEGGSRFSERKLTVTGAYVDLALQHELRPEVMALAFVRQRPFVATALAAASNAAQLEDNLRSLEVTLSKDLVKKIDALHDLSPNPR